MKDRSRATMKDLITEAERRDVAGAEWMDRATLLRALEASDGEGGLGPLARARRFLGHVTGLDRVVKVVRGAIDPARPEAPTLVTERSASAPEPEPEPASPIDVAISVAAPRSESVVIDGAEPEAAPSEPSAPLPPPNVHEAVTATGDLVAQRLAPAARDLLAGDPSFGGMRVVSRDGHSWLVWRAPASRLAAIGRGSELTLRMVSIGCTIGQPDAEVVVETDDEPGLALEGVRALPDVRGRPCVAAIGVGRGDGFVAVAHARVA